MYCSKEDDSGMREREREREGGREVGREGGRKREREDDKGSGNVVREGIAVITLPKTI